jgi:hypothetical protein
MAAAAVGQLALARLAALAQAREDAEVGEQDLHLLQKAALD